MLAQKKTEDTQTKPPLFAGLAVQGDVAGLIMGCAGAKFANMEAAVRLNFRETYFPICEVGFGKGKREGQETDNTFKAHAPYFRIGADYNFSKPRSSNHYFAGLRYGWTAFNYDFTSSDFTDPVWGGTQKLNLTGQNGRAQWLEIVAGMDTRIWKFIHLGWNLRYKARIHQKTSQYGSPWYIPGFGVNGSSTWGGTVNLIFDIETKWTRKNKTKSSKEIHEEALPSDSLTTQQTIAAE